MQQKFEMLTDIRAQCTWILERLVAYVVAETQVRVEHVGFGLLSRANSMEPVTCRE